MLATGETIYAIAPNLTSQYHCRRGTKKNDQVDAANVARALLANPQLPSLQYSDRQRELQELSRAQRKASRTAQTEPLRSRRTHPTLACTRRPRGSDPHADPHPPRQIRAAQGYRHPAYERQQSLTRYRAETRHGQE